MLEFALGGKRLINLLQKSKMRDPLSRPRSLGNKASEKLLRKLSMREGYEDFYQPVKKRPSLGKELELMNIAKTAQAEGCTHSLRRGPSVFFYRSYSEKVEYILAEVYSDGEYHWVYAPPKWVECDNIPENARPISEIITNGI